MESKAQQSEPADIVSLKGLQTENLPMLPPAKEPETQWQQIGVKVANFLAQLPEYLGDFFEKNQRTIINLSLIVAILVSIRVLFAAVDAINHIPLLYPFFELVGIGYATWFIFRYLIKASTRQELGEKFQVYQKELTGMKDANIY
ncbi:MAG: CAAD domain-containing protein [Rhizonema sp. PD37]|nr:CAAD domain-containing protein [Rhizonema sp. PD37]